MRNILALIGLVVVGFAGAGWYFGWYQFAVSPSLDGKQHIQVEVDTKKIGEDAKKLGETVNTAVQNAKQEGKTEFVGPPLPEGISKPAAPHTGPVSFSLPPGPGAERK